MDKYIKRLGQQHWSRPGKSKTLCGMPMLGNNYARESLKDEIVGEIKPCEICERLKEESKGEAAAIEVKESICVASKEEWHYKVIVNGKEILVSKWHDYNEMGAESGIDIFKGEGQLSQQERDEVWDYISDQKGGKNE